MIDAFITHAPVIGLLFFFTVFIGVIAWMIRPGMKQKMQQYGRIPLKEDQNGQR
jgi:cbb3-type cytochrome oxidase subunit 3